MNKMLTTMALATAAMVPATQANDTLIGDGVHATAKCFYECKSDFTGRRLQEVTTLVIPEPFMGLGVYDNTLAQIKFYDGNQRLVASTSTVLPPYDMDEINVCATIEQYTGPAGVPSAGLIDVSYHVAFVDDWAPEQKNSVMDHGGGGYEPTVPWVKNVLGAFAKQAVRLNLTDPFVRPNLVKGIAKTECRLNAWEDYYVPPMPGVPAWVPPAYIEGTGENDLVPILPRGEG